jgi:thiosulfate dehydrogenase [quinone] large subunit
MARDGFYLGLRAYVAWQWLKSGIPKVTDAAWVGTGEEVRSFVERVSRIPEPPARPPIAFGWYRSLLQALMERGLQRPLAVGLVLGNLTAGVGLLLGIRTRGAAAVGLAQNLAFSLAGSAGHNPLMLVAETILIVSPDEVDRIGVEGWLRSWRR